DLPRLARVVNVGTLLVVALHEALLCHDLHQLQHRGVLRRLALRDGFMDVAHGRGAAAPEHSEDLQLGICRPGCADRVVAHLRKHYYEAFRLSSSDVLESCTRGGILPACFIRRFAPRALRDCCLDSPAGWRSTRRTPAWCSALRSTTTRSAPR